MFQGHMLTIEAMINNLLQRSTASGSAVGCSRQDPARERQTNLNGLNMAILQSLDKEIMRHRCAFVTTSLRSVRAASNWCDQLVRSCLSLSAASTVRVPWINNS
jgi:hypothetical protein